MNRPLQTGLFAAVIVTMTAYMAENYDARLSGLFAAVPVALTATLFLKEKGEFKDWIEGLIIGLMIYFISALILYGFHTNGVSKRNSVFISIGTWLFLASMYILI